MFRRKCTHHSPRSCYPMLYPHSFSSMEPLEVRQLLAASISLGSDKILKLVGTDSGETISVTSIGGGKYRAVVGSLKKDVSQFNIRSITIDAKGGNDTISLSA